jgi:DNA-binding transcriptional MerR regulator
MDTNSQHPEKSYYKNSEVCSMTGVKPYVLRFWENEFPQLDPVTSSSGHKLYEWTHIQIVKKIKELLFDQKMTVDTAKVFLQEHLDAEVQLALTVQAETQVQENLPPPISAIEADTRMQETRWRECAVQVNQELTDLLQLVHQLKSRGQVSNCLE